MIDMHAFNLKPFNDRTRWAVLMEVPMSAVIKCIE